MTGAEKLRRPLFSQKRATTTARFTIPTRNPELGSQCTWAVWSSRETQPNYDQNRNLARTSQGIEDVPDPRITNHTYDGYDRLDSTTDPMGNVMSDHYDASTNRGQGVDRRSPVFGGSNPPYVMPVERQRGAVEDGGPSTEGDDGLGLPGPERTACRMTVTPTRSSWSIGVGRIIASPLPRCRPFPAAAATRPLGTACRNRTTNRGLGRRSRHERRQ